MMQTGQKANRRQLRELRERTPPSDLAAEKQLLACIMVDARIMADIRPEAFWFHDPTHRTVCEAMTHLHRDGIVPDLQAILSHLSRSNGNGKPILDRIGGAAALGDIANASVTFATAPSYVKRVRDAWLRRRKIALHEQGIVDAHDPNISGDAGLQDVEQQLADLRELSRHGGADNLVIVSANEVESVNVTWLSEPWLPLGALSLFDGDPGSGKTTVCIDHAARLTTGRPMAPHDGVAGTYDPCNVLLISGEDNIATTIVPRLEAAGADLARVQIFRGKQCGGVVRPLAIPEDCDDIEQAIVDHQARFVLVDPITAYLSETVNANRDADVRRALHPLAMIAERQNTAILMIRHMNKNEHQSAMYRGGGSIAFIAAARASWIVGRDPDDQDVFVLAMNKLNVAKHPRAIRYQIESTRDTSRIKWLGACDLHKDQILPRPGGKRPSKADDCAKLLRKLLADGPVDSAEIHDECKDEGFGRKAVEAARDKIGVVVEKAGFNNGWQWRLPTDEERTRPANYEASFDVFNEGAPKGTSSADSTTEGTSS